jgi:hypothetical protein
MSLYGDDRYTWRETYFVYFDSTHRPKLADVRRELHAVAPLLKILDSKSEPDGRLTAMTVASYEDHAALEIVYREGNDVLDEIRGMSAMLEIIASQKEKDQLHKIVQCKSRFDVLHFEQTAGTAAFNAFKVPTLKFGHQSTDVPDRRDGFSKALRSEKKPRFHFDPESYDQCINDGAGQELDAADTDTDGSAEYERIDPSMLVAVLETLCRQSRGVAIDPASGIII